MKNITKYTLLAAGCALSLASCDENEWNDKLDGFVAPEPFTEVETINYTLTPEDYASIASNSTNRNIAIGISKADSLALAAVGTNGCFESAEQARMYLPAFLSQSSFPYFALNNGSSIKVSFALTEAQDPEVLAINAGVSSVAVPVSDSGNVIPYLNAAVTDAADGSYAVVNFQNPVVYFDESFYKSQGVFTTDNVLLPEGSTYVWSFDTHGYMKASGYVSGKNCDSESWLVSPGFTFNGKAYLSFDQAWNYFTDMNVAATENLVAIREVGTSEWTMLTPANLPVKNSWTFVNSGDIDISSFSGKTVQVGFCYKSTTTKAGTTELKNVKIVSETTPGLEPFDAVYRYNGFTWVKPGSMVMLQSADYVAIGQTGGYLSSTQPQAFIPVYLKQNYPYAQADESMIVVYAYGNASEYKAMQFTYDGSAWSADLGTKVEQFTKSDNKWSYNPSVVITLPYSRTTEPSYTYYLGCVRWVFENISKPDYGVTDMNVAETKGFIRKGGEAEYYSGASAFYGNVDIRAITAKNNAPEGYTGYEGLTDDEITLLVEKRFCLETMRGSLEYLHPEAEPVDGMVVTYTINFTSFDGSDSPKELVYVVSGKGKFKYKSCTWFENGEDAGWE